MARVVLVLAWCQVGLCAEPGPNDLARAAISLAVGGCGLCRDDEAAARMESLESGRPLVLFVGGCDGRAAELPPSAIAVRATEYAKDGHPAGERRIVVLAPQPNGKFHIRATVPANAPAGELLAAVSLASRPAGWDIGGVR